MRVPLTALQRLALDELRRQGDIEPDVLRIEVRLGAVYSVIGRQLSEEDLGENPMAGQQNGAPRRGKLFSPIEEAILKAATADWQTATELASKVGQTRSSWFCAILSNLVEREYLEGGRNGYRLIAQD